MGIKVVHKEARPCKCDLPRRGDFTAGDIVQCDQCRHFWRCKGLGPVDPYKPGDETLQWEKVRQLWNERNQKHVYEPFALGLLKDGLNL
jgi:hypothetical protein